MSENPFEPLEKVEPLAAQKRTGVGQITIAAENVVVRFTELVELEDGRSVNTGGFATTRLLSELAPDILAGIKAISEAAGTWRSEDLQREADNAAARAASRDDLAP